MMSCHQIHACRFISLAATAVLVALLLTASASAGPTNDAGRISLDSIPGARFTFDGVLGQRVKADIDNWLLGTPAKNPGLLDMFAERERNTEGRDVNDPHQLVPWSGEFVGKYLTTAALAMRMSDDPRLRETVGKVVDRLVQLQAEDGYLGPWPKNERLLGHWDLWGHYHIMLGLMFWHEQTGDEKALAVARKMADLVCVTYLDTGRRVASAGSEEMNMGIVHGLALLYRKTGDDRYLRMAKEVVKDFEKGGDYYRQGLQGIEYFRTPKPRWESLHSLQGLAELYRITGDETFRRSFLHHWASMRRFDLRNTGGFSAGEQATGNPFNAEQAIETCCVIAWEAVMLDALRLTGDATIADDLELATFNAVAGAQHPSGEWCTYNTPINGVRGPSYQQIAFQARPNAPFLNCCSVNGPRGFGMLSEWGVMRNAEGLTVNYYGPGCANVSLSDGTPITIEQTTDYPIGNTVRLKISLKNAKQFTLALRIPAWSTKTEVLLNGEPMQDAKPGTYLKLARLWRSGDEIKLTFDMGLRYESGDLEQAGNVSLYRGPILLCADDRFQSDEPIKIDVSKLGEARIVPNDATIAKAAGPYSPWLVVDVPTSNSKTTRLIDFANAGATGKGYRSWLSADAARPPRPVAWQPADGATLGTGPIRFKWRKPALGAKADHRYKVVISSSPDFGQAIALQGEQKSGLLMVPTEEVKQLQANKVYYWKVVASNSCGESESLGPYKRFTIDPSTTGDASLSRASDGMIIAAPLRGDIKPEYGKLIDAAGWKPAVGPDGQSGEAVELDGKSGRLRYDLSSLANDDYESYTAAIWLSVTSLPAGNSYGQVFSAWCQPMDDPLRLVVAEGKLFARIEAGAPFGTDGVAVDSRQWRHVVAVKAADKLTLYIDGQVRGEVAVPVTIPSLSRELGIGGNPRYPGPEFLAARFADLRLYGRALSAKEIKEMYEAKRAK